MTAPRVAILVPRRAGVADRDRLWEFTRQRWEHDHPAWPIIEGHHDHGPFNRSAAVNQAAAQAGEWDVALIIDADVVANPRAVADAVDIAHATGRLALPHNERIMLNRAGTTKVVGGYEGPWRTRQMVERIFTDSVSCVVAVPRRLWHEVEGFDEAFVGWGHEDSAFAIAAETATGKPLIRLSSELFHLWHPVSPDADMKSPTRHANIARLARYQAAAGDITAVRALRSAAPIELGPTRIPRILHRTVPFETTDEVERWWAGFAALHPGWDLRTWREPLDPAEWPLTADLWSHCANGAQRAGLIRLEALVTYGGAYVDSDVEPVRSLEPLMHCPAFAAWEDDNCVPDAVLGAEPGHPAFRLALEKARSVIEGGGDAWHSGPGVTTEILPNRPDVLVLPPGAFFDIHYLEKAKLDAPHPPFSFARHHWHGSWLTDEQRRSQRRRQRA